MKEKCLAIILFGFLLISGMVFTSCPAAGSKHEENKAGSEEPKYPVIKRADTVLRSASQVGFKSPVNFSSDGYGSIDWEGIAPGSAKVIEGTALTPPPNYTGGVQYQYAVVSETEYSQSTTGKYRVPQNAWKSAASGGLSVEEGDYLFIKAVNGDMGSLYCVKIAIIKDPIDTSDDPGAPKKKNPVFDINDLPTTAWWNEKHPHNHDILDIFQFADGRRVSTPEEWEERRAEIKKIVEYYEYGKMPPVIPEDISWTDGGNGTSSVTCAITVKNGTKSQSWTVTAALPSKPLCTPMPIVFNFANSWSYSETIFTNAGIATAGINYTAVCQEQQSSSANDKAGIVKNLFPEYFTGEDEISNMAGQAWALSVIAYVIQEDGFKGLFDPAKIITNGMSRWGKASIIAGAYMQTPPSKKHPDKYPNGNRIGIAVSGSSGGGGAALERHLSQIGYKDKVTGVANGRWELEGQDREGSEPKKYYLVADPDSTNKSGSESKIAIRAWPASPGKSPGDPGYYPAGADYGRSGITERNTSQSENRIETTRQAMGERTWFAKRCYTFVNQHTPLDVDRDTSQPNRGKNGIICSAPFDQHYLHALLAPNGFIIHEGYQTYRGGPERQFMAYLCARELWEFLGAGEKLGMRMYDITHSQPSYEFEDVVNFAKAIWGPDPTAPHEKFRQMAYPIDDPRSKFDYYRLKWAKPGGTPIAYQVKEMLEAVGADASGLDD